VAVVHTFAGGIPNFAGMKIPFDRAKKITNSQARLLQVRDSFFKRLDSLLKF